VPGLLEDGLLFSGDHILNGSTTVIDPPDGDMTAYLDSLDRLTAACVAEHAIDFILPAHGHVLGQAREAIAQLKAHRLRARPRSCGHAGAARGHAGRLGGTRLRRCATAHVAGGQALAAGACAAHPVRQTLCTPLETRASGLVVFTQDGRILRKLNEDAGFIEQEFTVEIQGDVSDEALQRLHQGPAPAVKVSLSSTSDATTRLRLAAKGIQPGQIARLCHHAGLRIAGIRRIRIGRVPLGALEPAQWRLLQPYERF
jgi:pseudouridine synthase